MCALSGLQKRVTVDQNPPWRENRYVATKDLGLDDKHAKWSKQRQYLDMGLCREWFQAGQMMQKTSTAVTAT